MMSDEKKKKKKNQTSPKYQALTNTTFEFFAFIGSYKTQVLNVPLQCLFIVIMSAIQMANNEPFYEYFKYIEIS